MKHLLLLVAALVASLSAIGCASGLSDCAPAKTCNNATPAPGSTTTLANVMLTINITPSGDGSVMVSAPSQNTVVCAETCALPIPGGSGPVTLTATAQVGNTFVAWTGCPNPAGEQCTISKLSMDTMLTATFQ